MPPSLFFLTLITLILFFFLWPGIQTKDSISLDMKGSFLFAVAGRGQNLTRLLPMSHSSLRASCLVCAPRPNQRGRKFTCVHIHMLQLVYQSFTVSLSPLHAHCFEMSNFPITVYFWQFCRSSWRRGHEYTILYSTFIVCSYPILPFPDPHTLLHSL